MAMEDKDIIDMYWARSETAVSETEKKYGRYCHYIARKVLCNDSDAEEIVNDAYMKVWNTIPPQRPTSLKSYVGMIARQLAFNAYESKKAKKRGGQLESVLDELSECIPDSSGSEDIGDSIALRDALNKFIKSLPRKTGAVFMRRYWYSSSVCEIAEEYRMKENHVNVLLFNTRKKLKTFLEKEGFEL